MWTKTITASAVTCLCVLSAQAQETPAWKISGFGTAAATYFTRSDADFTGGSGAVPDGAGRTKPVSLEPDSKAGLQVRYTPTQALELTLQAISKHNPKDTWTPTLEWANVKYTFNENFALRVGRIGHPFFMISDYRQVNYTNTALRPSQEVYNQVPMSASDVIEGLFRFSMGGGQLGVRAGIGRIDADATATLPTERDHDLIRVRDMGFLNLNYEIDALTIRAGYTQGNITYDALGAQRRLFDPLSAIPSATARAVRDRYRISNAKSSFSGIGAIYDPGDYIISTEYVMLRSEKGYNNADAWTILGGYRVGQFTPYISYGSAKARNRILTDGVAAELTPIVGPTSAARLQAGLQAYADASLHDQNTISVGVRWDFYKNLALKAQFDHVNVKSPSPSGFLRNTSSSYPATGGGNVLAVALDFIF